MENVTVNSPVLVQFVHTAAVYDTVVNGGDENCFVEHECTETFTMQYADAEELATAIRRFDGMIEYIIQ